MVFLLCTNVPIDIIKPNTGTNNAIAISNAFILTDTLVVFSITNEQAISIKKSITKKSMLGIP